jgi:flavin reductase (DIM6/NTAB) family NADH-FMN oxidoreductase RutF
MSDDAFDTIMRSLDPPMVVVTTAFEGEQAGCLVGFHAQSSIEPRRCAVWLSKANRTYRIAVRATSLAVHFLTSADHDLAAHFGGLTGDEVDKFADLAVGLTEEGVPLLTACPHRVLLRRTSLMDEGGDHVCFVGEPVDAVSSGPFVPLRLSAVSDVHPGHAADDC